MRNKVKFFLRVFLTIILLWLFLIIVLNFRSIGALIKFAAGYLNYQYLSYDLVPKNSDYKILYDFINLDYDSKSVPTNSSNTKAIDNNRFTDSNINYNRMLLILNCLDSFNIKYDTLRFLDRNSKSYAYNIFVKNNDSRNFSLLTAHYDILNRPGYQGAQDNTASVAILLNVVKDCRAELPNKDVAFLFTSMEEHGYLGAMKFMNYSRNNSYHIKNVLCLDGVGRGDLAVMRNSSGQLGLIYRNLIFKKKVFNGYRSYVCPKYSPIPKTVIDFDKYKIKVLNKFITSTDGSLFSMYRIPTVHLTSSDIPHFIKVMHQNKDKVDGLHYKSLIKCEDILTDYVKRIK